MINASNRTARQFAPYLQRVLVVDANLASTRMVAELLKGLGAARVYTETSDAKAMQICKTAEPQLIITDLTGPALDGLKLVRTLRRSTLGCRGAPVIVITPEATAASIIAARNAGVHEFLLKPFTLRDLIRRLEAVTLRSRDWIEAVNYIGPDRRRFNSGDYKGPRKRRADIAADAEATRIEQALKILRSAIAAIETDPVQALRAMQAQAANLNTIAMAAGDIKLVSATATLQRLLIAAAAGGGLSRPTIEAGAADLWGFMPAQATAELDVG